MNLVNSMETFDSFCLSVSEYLSTDPQPTLVEFQAFLADYDLDIMGCCSLLEDDEAETITDAYSEVLSTLSNSLRNFSECYELTDHFESLFEKIINCTISSHFCTAIAA